MRLIGCFLPDRPAVHRALDSSAWLNTSLSPVGSDGNITRRGSAEATPSIRFHLKGLMLAVAIVAALMLLLTSASEPNTRAIWVFGNAVIGRDGSLEVHDGAVRVGEDGEQAEIRANRIVVLKDGTTEVFGPCTILEGVR